MKYTKKNRVFLNTRSTECMGALGWHVSVTPHWNEKKAAKGALMFDASIHINDEAQSHYIERKASMVPLYKMRDELNKFIEACEQGLEDVRNQKDST